MIKFDDLSTEEVDRLVSVGIELMSTVSDIFGPEEGLQVWDRLSSELGEDMKHGVFMAMLSGTGSRVVRLVGAPNREKYSNRIEIIKLIRSYANLGLKEAKDLSDKIEEGQAVTIQLSSYKLSSAFIKDLRQYDIVRG